MQRMVTGARRRARNVWRVRGRCALMTGLLCSAAAARISCNHRSTATYFSALDSLEACPAPDKRECSPAPMKVSLVFPCGRTGLPLETVRAAQRERLLRSVIAAVAASGIGDVTVADIVRGARVSKAAFYAHFADKEDCFLAATREGGKLMIDRVAAAGRTSARGSAPRRRCARASPRSWVSWRTSPRSPAPSTLTCRPRAPRAVQRLEAAGHSFARMTRAWHERARREHPSWPAVPYQAYLALSGATAELVRAEVRHGKIGAIPALEDTLVALHLAVLAEQPWHGSQPPARPLPLASQVQAYRSSKSRSGPQGRRGRRRRRSHPRLLLPLPPAGGRAADTPPGKAARGRGCSR